MVKTYYVISIDSVRKYFRFLLGFGRLVVFTKICWTKLVEFILQQRLFLTSMHGKVNLD